ncbi:MAG TPA: carboxypeptidase regulatory-like domain-containing protein, partial [Silvibacterium sp.]|nr:carboxypeptidase regulatory-like domain-containing protein [Silvibacterium sp.]
LEAGNYYVAVTATPWYATRPQVSRDAEGNVIAGDQRSALDVAYPTTFYADVTDSDSATPIPVRTGDQVQVNFAMHAVPAVHLSVQVPSPSGRGFAMPQLAQEIFGSTDPVAMSSMRGVRGEGEGVMMVEFGVAPGQYALESRGRTEASRSVSIDATNDAKIDLSQAATMADVSGKVVMAGGEKLPDGLGISLRSLDGRNAGGGRADADGSFSLQGIPPGSYEVWANASDTSLAVTHLTATGATTEGHVLKVGSQPVAISATLAEGSATVTGFAKSGGKPAAGVMILLAPKDPAAGREMFRRDQSDSDGSFTLQRVIPGEYTVVAIEDGWDLNWAHSEVISHYLARGQKITVPPHSKDFSLKDAVEVQPK